jgi:soluble lytic murein transglycosylase
MFLTAQSFPVITSRLKNIKTEWALVHALIRQESMFDQYARSSAGAQGLMQLMPATAREVAKKLGLSYRPELLTAKPEYNIALGTYYIDKMTERFGGSYPMALAAYNAGPGRVEQWIKTFGDPRTGNVDLIDWIEMIPIYETRNYVQRVLEGVYVYRLRLKGIQTEPRVAIHTALTYR